VSTLPHLVPEAELVLLCARRPFDEKRACELLGGAIDGDVLLKLAARHAMAPLIYARLKGACAPRVPAAALARLQASYMRALRHGALYERELIRILDLLASRGIEVVPYKGPLLGALTQADAGLRSFVDLDILIRKRDLPRILEALGELDYRAQLELRPAQLAALLRFDYEMPLERERDRSLVDLQWASPPRFLSLPAGPDVAGARFATVTLAGRQVRTLCVEDLLLVLCSHGAKHIWERLQWIADVAALIETAPSLDWQALLDRAASWRRRRMLLLGLALARGLFDTELPTSVLDAIVADPAVERLAGRVMATLFDPAAAELSVPEQTRFLASAMDRRSDALRYLARVALTPTPGDWETVALPGWFTMGYYAVRPLRLLIKYVLQRRRR